MPTPPARSQGSGLTRRWHGAPVWLWATGAGVVGVGGFILWQRRKAKQSGTGTTLQVQGPSSPWAPDAGSGAGSAGGDGGGGGLPTGGLQSGSVPATPGTGQPGTDTAGAASSSSVATLSPADLAQIRSLMGSGLTPTAISYGQSAGGFGPSVGPTPVAGSFLAPLPESSPGMFPYAAVPLPPNGGVYTGPQAAAFGATTYNPTPGYGKSAYA